MDTFATPSGSIIRRFVAAFSTATNSSTYIRYHVQHTDGPATHRSDSSAWFPLLAYLIRNRFEAFCFIRRIPTYVGAKLKKLLQVHAERAKNRKGNYRREARKTKHGLRTKRSTLNQRFGQTVNGHGDRCNHILPLLPISKLVLRGVDRTTATTGLEMLKVGFFRKTTYRRC